MKSLATTTGELTERMTGDRGEGGADRRQRHVQRARPTKELSAALPENVPPPVLEGAAPAPAVGGGTAGAAGAPAVGAQPAAPDEVAP